MPPSGRRSLLDRARQSGAELLVRCSGLLTGSLGAADQGALLAVVARLGDLDAEADEVLDGAPGARWRKRRLRNLLASLLLVASRTRALARSDDPVQAQAPPELKALLGQAALRFRYKDFPGSVPLASADGRPAVADTRAALTAALADLRDLERAPVVGNGPARLETPLDWQGAARAATRTTLCVLPMGLAWLATGWAAGSLMLLGTCVFVTLLSANELGAAMIRRIVLGVLAGIGLALAFRAFVLPHPAGLTVLLLALVPVLCVTAAGLTFRLTAVSTVEFNSFFLMMSQPTHLTPLGPPLAHQGLAMLVGIGVAALALHLVMPLDIERRKRRLRQALAGDLAELAGGASGKRRANWEARTLSRGLRLLAGRGRRYRTADAEDVLNMLERGRTLRAPSDAFEGRDPSVRSVA